MFCVSNHTKLLYIMLYCTNINASLGVYAVKLLDTQPKDSSHEYNVVKKYKKKTHQI